MLRSPVNEEGAEPYWYARVLGVYHANIWAENSVIPGARNVRHMDFLWVRWFGEVPGYRSGFRRARLPAIGFVESTDDFAFCFVDPANVLRGCHLIPAFDAGRGADLLPWPGSVARRFNPEDTDDSDWSYFYVNMWVDTRLLQFQLSSNVVSFVDRDMVIRYFGGGIGHLKNTPPLQVPGFDPNDPGSDEMAVEADDDEPCSGTNDDLGTVVQKPSGDVIINGGELVQLELGEDDEDDEDDEEDDEDDSDDDDSEGGDQTDEDEDEEGEDDYGYASAWPY